MNSIVVVVVIILLLLILQLLLLLLQYSMLYIVRNVGTHSTHYLLLMIRQSETRERKTFRHIYVWILQQDI